MNDVMSLGSHRIFKKQAMNQCIDGNLLDLAAGTGDLSVYFRKRFRDNNVTLADPNNEMLSYAKMRLAKKYIFDNIKYVTAYAEKLPFKNEQFDNVSIGFGLRNFTDKEEGLKEVLRVLKSKGKLVIIDFSKPTYSIVRFLNKLYLKYFVPGFAKLFTGDIEEYQYLYKSISEHLSQSEIVELMQQVGFSDCQYINKLNGIIAIHIATK
jgi:demethylmenaquinone methyltransferase/2-methoxy-6-polyprenyl-1,4-benzoquinol methylase